MRKLIFLLVMALSTTVYGSRAKEIKYQSSADQSEQPAMFYAARIQRARTFDGGSSYLVRELQAKVPQSH